MNDNRRARLILALLILTAFTLITLDYRSGSGGPLRSAGNAVFGPIERAVSSVVRPIGSFFQSLGRLNSYRSTNDRLRRQNKQLEEQLRLSAADRAHLANMEKLLHLAGQARFRIVAARVVGVGNALNFEWTATIDVGSNDGVKANETVIDGDGLVGKTEDVGPTTSTVLLANDAKFTAGARIAGSEQIGHVDGGGRQPMTFTLLGTQQPMRVGQQLVTFASIGDRPFVPEVPIGRITRVPPSAGQLAATAVVSPYVNFTTVDIVGVVVGEPRTIPRDSLLPPSPTPSPNPSPNPTPSGTPSGSPSTPPPNSQPSGSPTPRRSG
jgi:rod shape-determining protein MreC